MPQSCEVVNTLHSTQSIALDNVNCSPVGNLEDTTLTKKADRIPTTAKASPSFAQATQHVTAGTVENPLDIRSCKYGIPSQSSSYLLFLLFRISVCFLAISRILPSNSSSCMPSHSHQFLDLRSSMPESSNVTSALADIMLLGQYDLPKRRIQKKQKPEIASASVSLLVGRPVLPPLDISVWLASKPLQLHGVIAVVFTEYSSYFWNIRIQVIHPSHRDREQGSQYMSAEEGSSEDWRQMHQGSTVLLV